MTQRLSYNYEYSAEREKAAKMNQIQSYVMILIENNKNYADELNLLRKDNTDLRGKLQVMMGEMLKNKQCFEDSLASTKASYAKEIGALINELKDILHQKEQMQASYKSLLEQISYQSEYDKNNRALQLNELERNYENKIKILNDRILEQNKELESNFYSNSDSKIKMVKEIDALRFEIGELKKENNDLHQGQAFLQNELNRQSAVLKLTVKEKQQMGVNLLKLQQQKNQSIIELKQSNTLLRQQINDHIESIKKLQVSLIAKQKQYQNVYQRFLQQQGDRQEYEDAYHKLSSDFAQKQSELTSFRIEFNKLSDSTSKQIKRLNDLVKFLQADNSKYCSEKQQLQSANLQKQGQVYTLLERVQSIEREYEVVVNQLNKVEEQVLEYSRRNQQLTEQLEITLLEEKKSSEKCVLQSNHIDTLEKLLEKQKRRTTNLQLTSGDRENAYSKQLSIQNEVIQRYEFQMQTILRQKTEIINKFQSQKDRLIRTYETALRQKQITFKQKIRFLQNQIIELSK